MMLYGRRLYNKVLFVLGTFRDSGSYCDFTSGPFRLKRRILNYVNYTASPTANLGGF